MKITRPLTGREIQIIRLVADGHTNQQIATRLGLSPNTVKSHLHRITKILGTTGRAHTVATYLKQAQPDPAGR